MIVVVAREAVLRCSFSERASLNIDSSGEFDLLELHLSEQLAVYEIRRTVTVTVTKGELGLLLDNWRQESVGSVSIIRWDTKIKPKR